MNTTVVQSLKAVMAYELVKLSSVASLPLCLPDLRVITELDLTGEEKHTYSHCVTMNVGTRALNLMNHVVRGWT